MSMEARTLADGERGRGARDGRANCTASTSLLNKIEEHSESEASTSAKQSNEA
jgi:hypothetical protein